MSTLPLQGRTRFSGRALFVGNRLDLQSFRNTHRLAVSPLAVSAGAQDMAVLFRFGVVIVFEIFLMLFEMWRA